MPGAPAFGRPWGGPVDAAHALTGGPRAEQGAVEGAWRDALTGLPGRRLFADRLEVALAQAHRCRHRLAVVLLDLDRFKAVNERLGHAGGDELLRGVAERLASCVREGDTVARPGGDEFVLLLPGIRHAEDLVKVSGKLAAALGRPFSVQGREVGVTASGGISLYPEDGDDAQALLRAADTAMYRAKERGRDGFQMHSAAMARKAEERDLLEQSLRSAFDRREMAVHYQPAYDPRSGRLLGGEALLRWQRPELGLVMPKDFITPADFTGVILSMGHWVLGEACREARSWQAAARRDLWVAVNLSAFELQQPDLAAHVERALAESGLPARSLQLEVPEGCAMQDLDRTIDTLRELKALGVSLTIDGFGAGFSSLAHLRRLPVDKLKIDLKFVRGATTDPDDASVVTAAIAVAHSLGLRVAAQGVETPGQLSLLRALLCDEGQGFLWSPPVPAADFGKLLSAGSPPASPVPPRRRKARRRGRG